MERQLILLIIILFTISAVQSIKSVCSTRIMCPSLDSSGSGEDETRNDNIYTMETKEGYSAQGSVLEVKLQFTKCIPYNHELKIGPKSYDLVAVSAATGEQIGEFMTPPYNSESEVCPGNTISFRTTTPTVLDMPRTYRWRPNSRETVCFRATILHYDQAEKQCQTIEKCVTLNQLSTISEPATQSPSVELVFGPSANKIKACENNWQCDDPKYRNRVMCGCDPETNRCNTYPKKCEIRKQECIYQRKFVKSNGECSEPTLEPTTPPSTQSPTSTPTPPPIKGLCKLANFVYIKCSYTGDFKLTQCVKNSNGPGYNCFCVSYDRGGKYVPSETIINSCDSPDTYDLKCLR